MDSEKFLALDHVIESGYSNINGIVVVKNGSTAFERYYNDYGPDDAHHVASVTKSIISALVGIAIDAGYIKNIDRKVLDFFPEYIPGAVDGQKKEITIRHLLTMTAPYSFDDWNEPLDKLCMQTDWIKYILDMLGQRGKIGDFRYSTGGAHLLSAVITRSTGKSAREFANERLFKPTGMKEIPDYEMKSFGFDDLFGKNVRGWVKDPCNNSTGGWGLTLTPRDMARFGSLYLNHGILDGKRIIPEAWVRESVYPHSQTIIGGSVVNYGYLWWLEKEDGAFSYSALGDGGNVICCIPEKDLVVAVASKFMTDPPDIRMLIKDHIIPALTG